MNDYRFSIGDRVQVTHTTPSENSLGIELGEEGVILEENICPVVKLDKIHANLGEIETGFEKGRTWIFDQEQLELVSKEASAIDYLKKLGYTITKKFIFIIFVGMAVSCIDRSVIPFDELTSCDDCFNTDYCTPVEQGDNTELEFNLTALNDINLISNGDFASGSGWTAGANWSIGSGVADYTGATPGTALSRDTDNPLSEGYYLIKLKLTNVTGSLNFNVTLGGVTVGTVGSGVSSGFVDETIYLFKYLTPASNTLSINAANFSFTLDDVEVYRMSELGFEIKDCNSDTVYYTETDGTSVEYYETGTLSAEQGWGNSDTSFAVLTLDWSTFSLTDACYCLCVKDAANLDFEFVPNSDFSLTTGWSFTNVGASGWAYGGTDELVHSGDATSGTDKAEATLLSALDGNSCYKLTISGDSVDTPSTMVVKYDTALLTDQTLTTINFDGTGVPEIFEIDITNIAITDLILEAESDVSINTEFSLQSVSIKLDNDCAECVCTSNCISLRADHDITFLQGCNTLLTATCDNNAFGFNFADLSFTQRLRVNARLRNTTFDNETDYYTKSNGEKVLVYAETQENIELQIREVPEYVHSVLNMMLLCDTFTIDGVEYVKVGEYAPNWRKSSAKAPVVITVAKANQDRFNTYS